MLARVPDADAAAIDLGACVLVSVLGKREEGVVVEIVPPGTSPRSARVMRALAPGPRAPVYVVQCWHIRVLREAAELVLVWP